jgi:hypothetical protein
MRLLKTFKDTFCWCNFLKRLFSLWQVQLRRSDQVEIQLMMYHDNFIVVLLSKLSCNEFFV